MKFASRVYDLPQVDLKNVSNLTLGFFKEEGFVTQRFENSNEHIIQARKGGILRALLSTNKAITVVMFEQNGSIYVMIGVKEWSDGKVPEFASRNPNVVSKFFLETPESLWVYEIEHHLWNHIETNIEIS